ncbi:serine hydrolase domain-containing protein [Cognatilysobacter tabacisoli]|uniref:serine hydrolase domain-containing protein n=1 Tax=Cognatilysobacter tabacisoli TaxID=2315424 RepID=UPI0013009BD0|nr:serine hydrolase domain-containing protein [Lysobacter tabacisoli]
MRRLALCLSLLVLVTVPPVLRAQAPGAKAAGDAVAAPRRDGTVGLDAYLASQLQARRLPGLAVAVLVDGEVVHARGYGVGNLELGTPVTTRSNFNIASISKTFTALLVMRLVQDGKLALDNPIERHLASLPAAWRGITVAQLLSHTSGIPSFSAHAGRRCNPNEAVADYRRGDVLREVACHPLEFAPGSDWAYGDTGYYLLGLLVERASNGRYEDALARWITGPLGMTATGVLDYRAVLPQRVDGYAPVADGFANAPRFELDEFANGGLVSTLDDMTRLLRAFTTDAVLDRGHRERMWQPAVLTDGTATTYGFGLGVTPYEGHARYGHMGGGGLGFSTAFTHFPDHGVTVVVLANADQPPGAIGRFANELAARFFRAGASAR